MPFEPITSRVTSTKPWPACTHEAVAEVVDCPDDALRNLAITQAYHRLTLAVGERMGTRDITWTGFAVWASRTAGTFIRRDWMPSELYELITRLAGPARSTLERLDRELVQHVATGNRIVFAEVGPLFVELLELLDLPARRRLARAERVIANLRPGPAQVGGQAPLRQALRAYLEAAECADELRRAQLVLMGNLLIGYHEQWRLQPRIRGCFDTVWSALPQPRTAALRALEQGVGVLLRRALTQAMLIRTPGSPLRLARDLPHLGNGRMFPAELERIELAPLRRMLAELDRTPDTVEGSGAADWSDFDDRMNYLVDLFRSRQRDPELWLPPFDPGQVRAMARGELPSGVL